MRQNIIFPLIFVALGVMIIGCQVAGGQPSKPTVIIASPPSGSVYTQGEEIVVQSTATDPVGVTQVTLLVDGNVVHQDPSPVSQGQAQFSLIQSWIATGAGQHNITVRATNSQGATSDSGILVNIKEQDVNPQATSVVSIATAVPLGTATPLATGAALTDVPPPAVTLTPNVPPATAVPTCVISSKFVADVTIPDGTIFVPNAVFTKTWRVQNNGTCAWQNYSLVFVSGTQMSASGIYPVPATQPGATADLVVPMNAPSNYGAYSGNWKMRDAAGQLFGTNLTVVINVPSPATAVPPTHTPPPTAAGCAGQPNDFDFNASTTTITAGQSVSLSWTIVNNASAVYLSGGDFGPEPGQGVETPGNRTVSPDTTTTFKLKALCNNSGQNREKSVTVTVNASVGNFAGQWVHNFGTMTLTQNGNTVTGTYHNDFDGGNGVLAGIVTGNVLDGTYTKSQTLPIHFTLSNDGKRFSGNWNTTNTWCGARPGQNFPDGCSYQGHFNTDYGSGPTCDMDLKRKDNAVTGTYCNGTLDGAITYTPNQTVLTGNWHIEGGSQPFKFYLFGYNALQFNGNWGAGNQWCGWRNGQSAPAPCYQP